MGINYIEKRKKLFNIYSMNLINMTNSLGWEIGYEEDGLFKAINGPHYACPICLDFFPLDSLDQNSPNPLTFEDIPPKSLSGKPLLLTCKNCNNQSGSELDIHLKMDMELRAFFKGATDLKSTGKMRDGKSFKILTRFDKDKRLFQFIYSNKNPYAQMQVDKFAENWQGSTFNFEFKGPNKLKHKVALLRIAYLLAFKSFGYSYLYSEGGRLIRSQISDPLNEIITKPFLITSDLLKDRPGIHIVTSPKKLKCILVVFSLHLESVSREFGVLLPGPDKSHIESFMNYERNSKAKLSFKPIPKYDYLTDSIGYLKLWNTLR